MGCRGFFLAFLLGMYILQDEDQFAILDNKVLHNMELNTLDPEYYSSQSSLYVAAVCWNEWPGRMPI